MAALTCPNCQTVIGEGTTTCPGCGNALGASQATTYSTSAPPPPAGAHAASSPPPPAAGAHAKPQAKFDLASVGHVERLVGGATLVLFISLFLPWFGFKFALGTVNRDGLTSHGYLWVTLFISPRHHRPHRRRSDRPVAAGRRPRRSPVSKFCSSPP